MEQDQLIDSIIEELQSLLDLISKDDLHEYVTKCISSIPESKRDNIERLANEIREVIRVDIDDKDWHIMDKVSREEGYIIVPTVAYDEEGDRPTQDELSRYKTKLEDEGYRMPGVYDTEPAFLLKEPYGSKDTTGEKETKAEKNT